MKLVAELIAIALMLGLAAIIAANYYHRTEKREEWHRIQTKRRRYFIRRLSLSHCWQVIDGDTRTPVYDDAPYGQDKPLVFTDEDRAQQLADDMNANQEDEA